MRYLVKPNTIINPLGCDGLCSCQSKSGCGSNDACNDLCWAVSCPGYCEQGPCFGPTPYSPLK